jgi:hypothetical protein
VWVVRPDKERVRDLVLARRMEGEAGASYSPVRSSVVPTVDMGAPGTVTRDEDSKKPPVNSSLVVALEMALTLVQPLKHVDQNFLIEGPFGQEASYMSLQKVKVNLPLRIEGLRSNDAFRTSIEV